jgi:hypothetical protein
MCAPEAEVTLLLNTFHIGELDEPLLLMWRRKCGSGYRTEDGVNEEGGRMKDEFGPEEKS